MLDLTLYTPYIWEGLAEFKSRSSALLCTNIQIKKIYISPISWSTECAHILQQVTLEKNQGFHELIAADVGDVQAVRQLIETPGFLRHSQATSYENKKHFKSLLY